MLGGRMRRRTIISLSGTMADTKFKPGNPGRPKGGASRCTKLRDEMLEAFEQRGGVDGLVK